MPMMIDTGQELNSSSILSIHGALKELTQPQVGQVILSLALILSKGKIFGIPHLQSILMQS
ncbi:MAG TPA: hypothetical protein VMJ66_15025 [Geobacteraceae bacterium]|nr:hypothetical protein [Geobacteraceae bacterium]